MTNKPSSTHKKIIAETLDGNKQQGYVKFPNFAKEKGLELLNSEGQHIQIPWKSLKIVWFVRDWDESTPSNLQSSTFSRRPRLEGLWVRLRFKDDTLLDGILVNDLLHLNPKGFLVTPPRPLTAAAKRCSYPAPRLSQRKSFPWSADKPSKPAAARAAPPPPARPGCSTPDFPFAPLSSYR